MNQSLNEPQNQRQLDLGIAVATAYDLQKLRIMTGNRLCASFRQKLGMQPSDSEEEQEDQVKKILLRLRADYDLMTEGVMAITKADGSLMAPSARGFKPVGCITTLGEFMLFQQYLALEAQEEDHFQRTLPNLLKGIPIYDYYLAHVKGIGPAMAAVLVRYFDIRRARHPSSFWKYAGLDVVTAPVKDKPEEYTTRGRGRYKEHLVPKVYTTPKGEQVETVGISFNPFVKTKLMGVVASSFLKCKSPYAELYYNYKLRLDSHPAHRDKSKGYKHAMSLRYMIKQFLVDFHVNWCELEGLPRPSTYEEAKLGQVHDGGATRALLTHLVFPQKKAA